MTDIAPMAASGAVTPAVIAPPARCMDLPVLAARSWSEPMPSSASPIPEVKPLLSRFSTAVSDSKGMC